MNNVSYIITGSGKISAVVAGKSFTVDIDHPNYKNILSAVKDKNWNRFADLVDVSKGIKEFITGGDVQIVDGSIIYQGGVMNNTLTKRILTFMREGLPFEPLLNFLNNLLQNPSKSAVDELYEFIEFGEIPLTEDGFILAFKNVRSDWYSIRGNSEIVPLVGTADSGGHLLNAIGEVLEIRRNQVNEDRHTTCSTGLHFCSLEYLPCYENVGGHAIIVKINPRDVVSIPSDYNNTKGRCCRYEVLSEYLENYKERIAEKVATGSKDNGFDAPLYSSDGGMYGTKPSGQKFYQKRGEGGKFVKKPV